MFIYLLSPAHHGDVEVGFDQDIVNENSLDLAPQAE